RAHQQRLAQAWHALEQRVSADEQARQHAVDDVGVADDDFVDLLLHATVGLTERFSALLHRCGRRHEVYNPFPSKQKKPSFSRELLRALLGDSARRSSRPKFYGYVSFRFSLSSIARRFARMRRLV